MRRDNTVTIRRLKLDNKTVVLFVETLNNNIRRAFYDNQD